MHEQHEQCDEHDHGLGIVHDQTDELHQIVQDIKQLQHLYYEILIQLDKCLHGQQMDDIHIMLQHFETEVDI